MAGCGDDRAVADCNRPPDPKRQIEACTAVIAANPKSALAYNNRCHAHNELKTVRKALTDCNVAIKLEPNNASAYNNRGWAYEIRRSSTRRSEDYSKAMRSIPASPSPSPIAAMSTPRRMTSSAPRPNTGWPWR